MVIRFALLASMTDIEKSVKYLVTKANLRLVDLLDPHQDVRESTAGSATGTEVLKQQLDVSQPHPRRNAQFEKKLSDQLSAAEAQYTEQLKASKATYAEQLKAVETKHSEALKEAEAKHTEALKKAEVKHLEALQVTEATIASLEEELKRKDASIDKITASKEKYKEVSLMNYREAHKLQDELAISR
ncbi:uncharacterized protein LOC133825077 [Humulus lupulus]|uniref:uncharacterized protein LOC133825077 n=1 Tax=Humulus lupulus TaxID=3486 RepID=UPI002B4008E0|nr:uncharacterized protein LOC133825077 [Humulus lupulus]